MNRESPWWRDGALGACVVLGLLLRCWGLDYGLPHVYNPDEAAIMSRALSLANSGLNPGNFLYPSFYFYVLAGAVGLLYVVSALTGRVDSLRAFEAQFWTDPSHIYLLGRALSVTAGALTIVSTYWIGERVGGRRVARAAALLMAVAYIPIRDAHFVKHDVPVTLLVTLVSLATWRVWQRGLMRDSLVAGGIAGMAFATHYYALLTLVPLVVSHVLRIMRLHTESTSPPAIARFTIRDRQLWLSLVTFAAAFVILSPYVLLDVSIALRDIAGNRAVVVDRAQAVYGAWGAGIEHLRLLNSQGAGTAWLAVAAIGFVTLARRSIAKTVWLLSFPLPFFLLIANTWPFGRSENPLYPFLAVAGGIGIDRLTNITRFRSIAAGAIVSVCVLQPLSSALIFDRLLTVQDTRGMALEWIERHVPDGTGVAIEPYSVPLVPSRDRLMEALIRNRGALDRAGYRSRTALARTPYRAPAYRLYYLGRGGMDEDKIYVDPVDLTRLGGLDALRADGLRVVVLKRFTATESSPLRDRLMATSRPVYTASPFRTDGADEPAQLPDYDIRPTLRMVRPGPVIEIWTLP